MTTPLPPDPAPAADERTTLRGFLDFQRGVLRRKVEGLDADGLRRVVPPSTMTLGGLLKHQAWVESFWLVEVFAGREPSTPWAALDWEGDPDGDWRLGPDETAETVRALFDESVATADSIIDDAIAADGLGALAAREWHGQRVSLRWILVHLIEEEARHAGHADLLREAIDGTTGD